jgi:hypothetical protein
LNKASAIVSVLHFQSPPQARKRLMSRLKIKKMNFIITFRSEFRLLFNFLLAFAALYMQEGANGSKSQRLFQNRIVLGVRKFACAFVTQPRRQQAAALQGLCGIRQESVYPNTHDLENSPAQEIVSDSHFRLHPVQESNQCNFISIKIVPLQPPIKFRSK